jgi:predicted RNase H-like nuclease (RuvC/YqgF family)
MQARAKRERASAKPQEIGRSHQERISIVKRIAIASWSVAFIVCSTTIVNAQTIADIARQARAQRQNPPATIVITNQNLKTEAPAAKPEEDPSVEVKAEETKPATETPAAPADGRDETWWRGQFEKVRSEIKRLETEIPVLDSELKTVNREFLTRAYDPDGRGQKAISNVTERLQGAQNELTRAKARVAQLEADLRRADAPASWAR